MKTILVFPGQGSQFVGMGKSLFQNFEISRLLFEEAEDTLKLPLKKWCFDGPDEVLLPTSVQQPTIFLVSYCAFRSLKQETPFKFDYVAGHSLGEITALTAIDFFTFPQALQVCRTRGQLMEQAMSSNSSSEQAYPGGMLATVGGEVQEAELLCQMALQKVLEMPESQRPQKPVLSPANFNTVGQTVLSGHQLCIRAAQDLMIQEGIAKKYFAGIKKLIPLKVSIPFHSALMQPVAVELQNFITQLLGVQKTSTTTPLAIPYLPNVKAQPVVETQNVINLLAEQVYQPVRWLQTLQEYQSLEIKTQIECGPGQVLAGLLKRFDREVKSINISGMEDVRDFSKS